MNVEFIVHGVISGQSFSKQGDIEYCKQFYGPQDAGKLMTMEVAKGPSGVCSYYNYLRSGNVVAEREGSYFGMTVRIDGFVCTDVARMWQVFNCVFDKTVLGKILERTSRGYKYCIGGFGCPAVEETERHFLNLFSNTFVSEDFLPISDENVFAGRECVKLNPLDTDGLDVVGITGRRAKVNLSPSYPTKQEEGKRREYEISINNLRKELKEARLREKELTTKIANIEGKLKVVDASIADTGADNQTEQNYQKKKEETPDDESFDETSTRWKQVENFFKKVKFMLGVDGVLTLAVLLCLLWQDSNGLHGSKIRSDTRFPSPVKTEETMPQSGIGVIIDTMFDGVDTVGEELEFCIPEGMEMEIEYSITQ